MEGQKDSAVPRQAMKKVTRVTELSFNESTASGSEPGTPDFATRSAATSTTGLPTSRISATTSTPCASVSQAVGFYRIGEEVGRETRNAEFKAGRTVLRDHGPGLFEMVGRYACGFLNSTEGGTLYIGVNDYGKVIGSICSRNEEDKVRQLVDQSIRTIEPSVFPTSYSVRFLPVMEESGYLSDSLQVLEIEIHPTNPPGRLYDFKGSIFMRRDGSLQGPLKGREIQEWIRTHIEKELAERAAQQVSKQLRVLGKKLAAEQDMTEALSRQLGAEQKKSELTRRQLAAAEERNEMLSTQLAAEQNKNEILSSQLAGKQESV